MHVVVVGGGVGGLATALALARAGHRVTVLERDALPPLADAEQAFATERRGAPQVHQTHGFLARLQVLLRERFPDVLDRLLAAGCTTMSTTNALGEAQPGDDDLRVLVVRRTTFEWVLRGSALEQPDVDLRTGVGAAGVVASSGSPPTVHGVRLDDGSVLDADLVVSAGGRRAPVPEWLAAIGVDVPETIRESGLVYLTRWYRFPDGPQALVDPKLAADLGFVKYLGVPGDGATLSVTLAIRPDDADLRAALSDPDRFDLACRLLPGPDRFFADGPLDPIGGVRPMGGLLNRLRRFVDDDGRPTVLGFHAVGDAHTTTNPLYGRGCSLALVQAVHLADAFAAHPDDAIARAAAYEDAARRQIEPWYHNAVELDAAGADPTGVPSDAAQAYGSVLVAAQTDPVIGRAMARFWNLLGTPAEIVGEPAVMAAVAAVLAEPERYPVPPREGPTRDELVRALEDAVHA